MQTSARRSTNHFHRPVPFQYAFGNFESYGRPSFEDLAQEPIQVFSNTAGKVLKCRK